MTGDPVSFPEPTAPAVSRAEVLIRYLDYFRASVIERIESLDDEAITTSGLPSGWTPLELVVHLSFVERRWLEWGFEGRDIGDPWGDQLDERWNVPAGQTRTSLLDALRAQGATTRAVVGGHRLDEVGAAGQRWDGESPATLERILLHLLQEYARHLGQLDVVTELAGGAVDE